MLSLIRMAKAWIRGEAQLGASECSSPARNATSDIRHILPSPGLPIVPLTSSTRSKARCSLRSRSMGRSLGCCRLPLTLWCQVLPTTWDPGCADVSHSHNIEAQEDAGNVYA